MLFDAQHKILFCTSDITCINQRNLMVEVLCLPIINQFTEERHIIWIHQVIDCKCILRQLFRDYILACTGIIVLLTKKNVFRDNIPTYSQSHILQ